MSTNGYGLLTPRQLEILAHVANGMTIDQAAEAIHIAPRSAYNTMGDARRKTHTNTITRLTVIAIDKGWLEKQGGAYIPATALRV
jgi:DNA-binding CsgD family transcriptional regulator